MKNRGLNFVKMFLDQTKKIIIYIFFAAGGAISMWFYTQVQSENYLDKNGDFIELLAHGELTILEEGLSCGIKNKTVAAVLANRGFFQLNTKSLSRTQFSCDDTDCSIQVSSCRPWQSSDCGETFLKYKIDQKRKIIPSSLSCFDVP